MGIRTRRQTTKSVCQITMAMNNDGDGRCDSIFVHIKLLTSAPHWHIDYWHIDFCKTMQKSHVPMEPKQKWKRKNQTTNINSSCQTKRRKTIMTDVANHFFCVERSFWRHIHTLTFCMFWAKSMGNKNDTSTHTHKSIVIVFQRRRRLTFSFAFRHQFYVFDHNLNSTCPH